MMEHNDDILCLDVSKSGQYAVTGQIGPKPWIFVWRTTKGGSGPLEVEARICGHLKKGIRQIAFSPDETKIVATAMDDDHTIAVYDWQKKLKTGQTI